MQNSSIPRTLLRSMIVCPDFTRSYPKIKYGKGAYLFDENDRPYLDASSCSSGVANLGHGLEEIADVVSEQMRKVAITPTHAFSNEVVEQYLDELVSYAGPGYAKAWLASSGTEAVENALKLALQYHQLRGEPGRYKVLGRWASYHGNSVFTLDVGGMRTRRNAYSKWLHNFPHVSPAYAYRMQGTATEEEYTQQCALALDKVILEEGPESIAAFVIEPIVGAALGAVPPPKGYMEAVRNICDHYGILLIADEVLTGFGRTGEKFGMDHWEVQADIMAVGKGISGGYYPLSGMIISEKVAIAFEKNQAPFLGGHTFSCNPVGAAVGSFILSYMQKNRIIEHVQAKAAYFRHRLDHLYKHPMVGDIRGKGFMMGIELVKDRATRAPFARDLQMSKRIGQLALDKGVILYPGTGSVDGIYGDHILIEPPLISGEKELDLIVEVLDECMQDLRVTRNDLRK